jgi:hypothetical protein
MFRRHASYSPLVGLTRLCGRKIPTRQSSPNVSQRKAQTRLARAQSNAFFKICATLYAGANAAADENVVAVKPFGGIIVQSTPALAPPPRPNRGNSIAAAKFGEMVAMDHAVA